MAPDPILFSNYEIRAHQWQCLMFETNCLKKKRNLIIGRRAWYLYVPPWKLHISKMLKLYIVYDFMPCDSLILKHFFIKFYKVWLNVAPTNVALGVRVAKCSTILFFKSLTDLVLHIEKKIQANDFFNFYIFYTILNSILHFYNHLESVKIKNNALVSSIHHLYVRL